MNKLLTLLFLLIALSIEIQAQNTIELFINNIPATNAYISIQRGDAFQIKDSLLNIGNQITFNFNKQSVPGQYSIVFAKSKREAMANKQAPKIGFIYNNENVKIKSNYFSLQDSLQFTESRENKLYLQFFKKENEFQHKLALIDPIVNNFPKEDKYLTLSIEKYNTLQKEREKFIKNFITQNAGTFVAKIAEQYNSPFLDGNKSEKERVGTIKNEYLSYLNFQYPELIYSRIYTEKIIQYVSLYGNRNYNRTMQEAEYIKAVDKIANAIQQNQDVNDFLLKYLTDGFEYMQMETVLAHIAENYINKKCETENQTLLAKRLQAYRDMALQKIVPDILIQDIDNDFIQLSALKNQYKLLIFWSTQCPHCTNLLPELKKWYDTKGIDLEVLAISIDSDKESWKTFVNQGNYTWININDEKGWDGEIAKDYNLYATPTMFVLDKENKILAKPITFNEFLEFVGFDL
ncbi:MAG: TlpA disulfide reductase family protein [Bacteroidales bacterium]|jgi:peroxiredoxin|nr:TlpA disulfide reductase family protein [Bacteroidales bacterium]